ncbi:MAG: cyclic pyranopterin monophosphate synthase MoaC [Actinomycetota bacterium]
MNNLDNFTHTDSGGKARMVDVSGKKTSLRKARARGRISLTRQIFEKVKANQLGKGDVLTAAKIAGIAAAKRTWELIPLCHQVRLTGINLEFNLMEESNSIEAVSAVKGFDITGVEMEALTAVSVSLLTIYDMCKALSKEMRIEGIELLEKTGGKSNYIKSR